MNYTKHALDVNARLRLSICLPEIFDFAMWLRYAFPYPAPEDQRSTSPAILRREDVDIAVAYHPSERDEQARLVADLRGSSVGGVHLVAERISSTLSQFGRPGNGGRVRQPMSAVPTGAIPRSVGAQEAGSVTLEELEASWPDRWEPQWLRDRKGRSVLALHPEPGLRIGVSFFLTETGPIGVETWDPPLCHSPFPRAQHEHFVALARKHVCALKAQGL